MGRVRRFITDSFSWAVIIKHFVQVTLQERGKFNFYGLFFIISKIPPVLCYLMNRNLDPIVLNIEAVIVSTIMRKFLER